MSEDWDSGSCSNRNAAPLWERVRFAVADFLHRQFVAGAFAGSNPHQAFFVSCDETTMTAHDLTVGTLRVLVGFAPLRPAKFVVRAFAFSVAADE